jgi:integrase
MGRKRRVSPVSGIRPIRRRLSDGTRAVYWYHRATGKRLRNDPNSADGLLEIQGLDRRAARGADTLASLASVISAFKLSSDYTALRAGTRALYLVDFRYLEPGAAEIILPTLRREEACELIQTARESRGVRAAQLLRGHLMRVCAWAMTKREFKLRENVFSQVPVPKLPRGVKKRVVNRRLETEEIRALFQDAQDAPGYRAWLAIMFLGGTRGGDARKVLKSAYRDGRLRINAEKNAHDLGIEVGQFFAAILDEARAIAPECPTLAHSAWGRPWSKAGTDHSWASRRTRLEASGALRPGATPHGLRHSLAAVARDLGASDFETAAAINNKDEATAKIYGREADRRSAGNRARAGVADLIFGTAEVSEISTARASRKK